MQHMTKICEFCGKEKEPRILEFKEQKIYAGYHDCNCEGAVNFRKQKQEEEEKHLKVQIEMQKQRNLIDAGIPKRYRNAFHVDAPELADDVLNGNNVYIYGNQGTGKTLLAMSIAKILIEDNHNVKCLSSYELIDATRSIDSEDKGLIDSLMSVEILVIDDIGKEASNTQHSCERLFAIIDTRYNEMLPTIFTSNYSLGNLAKQITENDAGISIASRIKQTSKVINLTGQDRRIYA